MNVGVFMIIVYGESNDLTVKWVWAHNLFFLYFKVLFSFFVYQSFFFCKQLKRIINFCQLCFLYLLTWSSQILPWISNRNILIVIHMNQIPSNPVKYNNIGGSYTSIWNKGKDLKYQRILTRTWGLFSVRK